MGKRKGFTLTETLVMVAVVGIIAVITIVSLRNMRPNKDAAMLRKAYSEMSKVVYSLANDEQLYPSAKVAYNMNDYILFDETNFFAAFNQADDLNHEYDEDAIINKNGCLGAVVPPKKPGGGGGGGASPSGDKNKKEISCEWEYAADGSKVCADGCHLVGDICKADENLDKPEPKFQCGKGAERVAIGTVNDTGSTLGGNSSTNWQTPSSELIGDKPCRCTVSGKYVDYGVDCINEVQPPKLECPEGSTQKGTKCECSDGQTVPIGTKECPPPKITVNDPDGGGIHSWIDKLTSSFAGGGDNGNGGTSSNVTTGSGDLSSGGIAIGAYDTKTPHNISGRKIFTNTEVPSGATAYSATNKFAYNFMNGFDTKQTSLNGKVATFTTTDGMKWTVTDNFSNASNPYAEVSVDIRGKGKASDTYYFYIDAGGGISLISGKETTAKGKNLLTNRSIKTR